MEYKEAFSGTKFQELQKFARRLKVDIRQQEDAFALFFALHTYFALVTKLLAWLAVSRYMGVRLGTPSFGTLASLSSDELRRRLQRMEDGGIFREYEILNFLEGDFFTWYLAGWDGRAEEAVRNILERLNDYDPTTLEVNPEETRDLLKNLYHKLMPREARHNLGEYYTPDWLAQRLLNQVDYAFFNDDPQRSAYLRQNVLKKRFLDPACGSGTFLVLIIRRIREVAKELLLPKRAVLEAICKNVMGIDLNPLAAIAARTNYLLALGELLEHRCEPIDIPVYLADSILPPQAPLERVDQQLRMVAPEERVRSLKTVVRSFPVPGSLVVQRFQKERGEPLGEGSSPLLRLS